MKLSTRTQRWTWLVFGLLLAIGLLVPLPKGGRLAAALSDSVHAPAFALLAVLSYRVLVEFSRCRSATAAWITCLSLIALGAASEAAQYCVGRSFSLKDIAADGLGVVAGTLWAIAWARQTKWSRCALCAAAAALLFLGVTPAILTVVDTALQYRDFPVLASFEQPLERLRWRTWSCRMHRCAGHAADGDWSARVELQPGKYPGMATYVPVADWTGYKELIFDVELDEGPPLDWFVGIADRSSRESAEDQFERRFRLKPGQQRIVVSLADVERGPATRPLDLGRISLLRFYVGEVNQPRILYLDNVRLR